MLMRLLTTINIILFCSIYSNAQRIKGDTVGLSKQIETILKKRGFRGKTNHSQALFNLAIINTDNQSGGQNAFSITNNIGVEPPDSTNVEWEIGCIDDEDCLVVYPKKGSWGMPYILVLDSTSINFKYCFTSVGGYDKAVTENGDTIVLRRVMSLSPASASNALIIGPVGGTCFYFGDYSAPDRNYHYSDGHVFWTKSEEFKRHMKDKNTLPVNYIKEHPFRPMPHIAN